MAGPSMLLDARPQVGDLVAEQRGEEPLTHGHSLLRAPIEALADGGRIVAQGHCQRRVQDGSCCAVPEPGDTLPAHHKLDGALAALPGGGHRQDRADRHTCQI